MHWHFAENSHRLLAKQSPSGEMLAIVSDHLGTPKEMFDNEGVLVWAADHHVWGADHHVWGAVRTARTFGELAVKTQATAKSVQLECPWRFPGQYEDIETGLYYNRYRYYDPLTGQYASTDPIGLNGGPRPQGYVRNPTVDIDVLGLAAWIKGQRFRGDVRPPEEIFVDGFKAKGDNMNMRQHVLGNDESGYIPTTIDESVASSSKFSGERGYVYELDPRIGGNVLGYDPLGQVFATSTEMNWKYRCRILSRLRTS